VLRTDAERMRFANGLVHVQATPMQVARATAGLVTGRLPDLRLVRAIDGKPVEASARELGISERSRRAVMRALEGVVAHPGGTGSGKGLDRATLGFGFACKTGSADVRELPPEAGGTGEVEHGQRKMLKQSWVAGWFPVEEPRAIVVVMLHLTSETASHSSVHVASQFLSTPEVRAFATGGAR